MQAYAADGELPNAALYAKVADRVGLDSAELDKREPNDRAGQQHSVGKHRIRWIQQTAKRLGLLKRSEGKRVTWQLTGEGERHIGDAPPVCNPPQFWLG